MVTQKGSDIFVGDFPAVEAVRTAVRDSNGDREDFLSGTARVAGLSRATAVADACADAKRLKQFRRTVRAKQGWGT